MFLGVRTRLHHFRDNKELPWISYDDNYDNKHQPMRKLRDEVKVMPGDQLSFGKICINSIEIFLSSSKTKGLLLTIEFLFVSQNVIIQTMKPQWEVTAQVRSCVLYCLFILL